MYKTNIRKYGYNIEKGGHINKVSEETKIKISIANSGRKHTEEEKQKMSLAHKGVPLSKEHKKAMCGKTAWNKGIKTPLEVRKKQRKAKLNKYTGVKHWNSKKVINLETGIIYNSFGEVARELNIKNASHIVAVCKGNKPSAYGYHWAYV